MTTDTVDKQATAEAGGFRVGGCAKGVGMIAPNLATMLVFVTTDARVAHGDLQRLADEQLKEPVQRADRRRLHQHERHRAPVRERRRAGRCRRRARHAGVGAAVRSDRRGRARRSPNQLIADGEGVTHVMLVDIAGAASEHDARVVAKAVADSPLVKTAAFGGDPNPGRILQAVGSSGVDVDAAAIDVAIGGVRLVEGGTIPAAYFDDDALSSAARIAMKEPEIHIEVSIGNGPGASRALGCDLSYEYVRINGEYTT